jgi:hypothetical protein
MGAGQGCQYGQTPQKSFDTVHGKSKLSLNPLAIYVPILFKEILTAAMHRDGRLAALTIGPFRKDDI